MQRGTLFCFKPILIGGLVVLASIAVSAGAEKNGSNNNLVPTSDETSFVSSEALARMTNKDLLAVVAEYNATIPGLQKMFQRKDNVDLDFEFIKTYGRLQCQESLQTLFELLRKELRQAAEDRGDQKLLITIVQGIGRIATVEPKEQLEEFEDAYKQAQSRLKGKPLERIILRMLDQAREKMKGRTGKLYSVNALLHKLKVDSIYSLGGLERVEAILKRKLIGQPEVLDAMMEMEWRSVLYGKTRSKPDVLWLMGMSKTGKDTAAEGFTDALHGYINAHEKHMFRMPVMKAKSDLWQVLGSSTGYIGSEEFPAFLSFLIQHSGGKYRVESEIDKQGKRSYRILDNADYKGETLPGYYPPETGVVFVNNFQNWSKKLKDDFILDALQKGYFSIANSNGGLSEVYIPVRFIIASTDGVGLTTARESNGQRQGKAMTYEQSLKKWENVHDNKLALKNEILSANGSPNNGLPSGEAPGISEELLSSIPDRSILLMRPLSPDDLKQITNMALTEIANKLAISKTLLGEVTVTWNQNITDFVQEYDYQAEDNAGGPLGRVTALIEAPLIDAIKAGKISSADGKQTLALDVETNADGTRSLVINVTEPNGAQSQVKQPINYTLKDRARAPITDERIDELSNLDKVLKANVFGIDPILERLADRVLAIENETGGKSDLPATVIMLNGPTSTGKTETAKQLSRALTGADDELPTLDFSQIQTMANFQSKILGLRDSRGNPIPSDFMKLYDRANGNLVVAFDELANVEDKDVLKSLYDLFREPVMSTFSDGKLRPMGGVKIIITGNAGIEDYAQVPSDLPMEVKMRAWAEIYRKTNLDYNRQRKILERYFPAPLIARIGRNNIFFISPHTYTSLRQVAQLKLTGALKNIAYAEGQRGWEVTFPNAEEYKTFIDVVVNEGFSLDDQGASIDSFIRDDFQVPLKALLVKQKVPSGARAVLKFRDQTPNWLEDEPGFVTYDVYIDGYDQPLEYRIRRRHVDKPVVANEVEKVVTAYHEAGHSIVRRAAFRDAYISTKITVIPGVDTIGGEWTYYLGVAKSLQEKEIPTTREWVIRQIAILTAGETAERLVVRGAQHSAGKQSDTERATKLAQDAIVKYGLSEVWGIDSVPAGMSTEAYLNGLSGKRRELLESEKRAFLKEGRDLGQQILEANFATALIPLATQLATQGEMDEQELRAFYDSHALVEPTNKSFLARSMDRLRTTIRQFRSPSRDKVEVELAEGIPMPESIADIVAIAAKSKQDQFDAVALPDQLPLGTNKAFLVTALAAGEKEAKKSAPKKKKCEALLESASAS